MTRDDYDAEYESSTSFPRPHFRDNTAYRHRYGRVQDMPPAPRPLIRVWEAWVALGVLLAWLAFIAWAIWRAGE